MIIKEIADWIYNNYYKISYFMLIIFLTLFIIDFFPVKIWKTLDNGQHTGIVTAVDYTGYIFKTYDVFFKTDPESTQEDIYCVIDQNIKNQLLEAQKNRELITIHYDSYWIVGYPLCGGNTIITGIERN